MTEHISALNQCGAITKSQRKEIVEILLQGMNDISILALLGKRLNDLEKQTNDQTQARVISRAKEALYAGGNA
jgi:hypothetical protein